MTKIKYADFNDYFQNDKKFFIRLLKDEVHKPQSKIYFADGTTYHVTKAGSRYWHYYDFDGNPLGFKGELTGGKMYWYCSLNQESYDNEADFWKIAHFLTE